MTHKIILSFVSASMHNAERIHSYSCKALFDSSNVDPYPVKPRTSQPSPVLRQPERLKSKTPCWKSLRPLPIPSTAGNEGLLFSGVFFLCFG